MKLVQSCSVACILLVQLYSFTLLDATEVITPTNIKQPPQPTPSGVPAVNTTTTSTTTTVAPNTTTTTTTTTTTVSPNTTTTHTPDTTTPTPPTTTPSTNTTTTSTTTPAPTPTPTPPPTHATTTIKPVPPTSKPEPDHKFDGPSFIGGIVFTLGLMVIGFISWKFYLARTGPNYHIL